MLGQDDLIGEPGRDRFKRSGLAHLLAVSGQNVVLLAILAAAALAVLGIGLRARLLAILGLIGVYVLVTGAGPSIQRAGVMGAAGPRRRARRAAPVAVVRAAARRAA